MRYNQHQEDAERALSHDSSGATADAAVDAGASQEQRSIDEPHSRAAAPIAPDEKPDQLADKKREVEDHQEALLDEAIEETFPGSDPISPKHIT